MTIRMLQSLSIHNRTHTIKSIRNRVVSTKLHRTLSSVPFEHLLTNNHHQHKLKKNKLKQWNHFQTSNYHVLSQTTFRNPLLLIQTIPIKSCSFSSNIQERENDAITSDPKPIFNKVLIANRGEIAVRVIRTCQRLGIKTVAIHSTADAKSLHVSLADEAVCVGPPSSLQSYLNIEAIVKAIEKTGAEAVHPGYGFLSENAMFSQKVKEMGVAFVGPSESAITAMGDKITSKQIAMEAGVNTIPGYEGTITNEEEAVKIANQVGYPVMIKATAGGGGKGMRIAYDDSETSDAFRLCKSEAMNFFKDDRLFIEKYIENPHHIEIQILAGKKDGSDEIDIVCFPERECSIQRRNQKIIEETPSVLLRPETRADMVRQCKALAKKVGYESAGTVEWLVDENQNFYFLEMNTRLQVEHPVTEMVTGVDLVESMLSIAKGEGVGEELLERVKEGAALFGGKNNDYSSEGLARHAEGSVVPYQGWALEARIYAEDPLRGFLPSTGPLLSYLEPHGKSVRVDSGVAEGHVISSHYDPMISKLIVHAPTRSQAIDKLVSSLDRYVIHGVENNKSFLSDVCRHPAFHEGKTPTNFIQKHYPDGFQGVNLNLIEKCEFAAILVLLENGRREILGLPPPPLEVEYFNEEEEDDDDWSKLFLSESSNGDVPGEDDELGKIIGKSIVALGGIFGEKYEVTIHQSGIALVHSLQNRGSDVQELSNIVPVQINVQGLKYNPKSPLVEYVVDGKIKSLQVVGENKSGDLLIQIHGYEMPVFLMSTGEYELSKYMKKPKTIDTSDKLLSPMPGTLVSYNVKEGDEIVVGQELCIVEAMKMQNILRSTRSGIVTKLHGTVGSPLQNDEMIMEFGDIA